MGEEKENTSSRKSKDAVERECVLKMIQPQELGDTIVITTVSTTYHFEEHVLVKQNRKHNGSSSNQPDTGSISKEKMKGNQYE